MDERKETSKKSLDGRMSITAQVVNEYERKERKRQIDR